MDPHYSATIDTALLRSHSAIKDRGKGKPFALIKNTRHPSLPLIISNYTQKTFVYKQWDPLTLAARSLVTNVHTGQVIARSFSKFFNVEEAQAYKPAGVQHQLVQVSEKVDGSLCSLFYYAEQWHIISKSQFEGMYVNLAWDILEERYPGATSLLDRTKTYVFEIIDPAHPTHVNYDARDMVLLSIFAPDGREPGLEFDWSVFPFTRPKIYTLDTVDLEQLRLRTDIPNAEGFVITFYHSEKYEYPERLKIKFPAYLELTKSRNGISPAGLLGLYMKHRKAIPSFKSSVVRYRMNDVWSGYLRTSVRAVSDDFGGEAWVAEIEKSWKEITAFFEAQDDKWVETTERLEKVRKSKDKVLISKRLLDSKIADPTFRPALWEWMQGENIEKQVELLLKNLPVPPAFRETKTFEKR